MFCGYEKHHKYQQFLLKSIQFKNLRTHFAVFQIFTLIKYLHSVFHLCLIHNFVILFYFRSSFSQVLRCLLSCSFHLEFSISKAKDNYTLSICSRYLFPFSFIHSNIFISRQPGHIQLYLFSNQSYYISISRIHGLSIRCFLNAVQF